MAAVAVLVVGVTVTVADGSASAAVGPSLTGPIAVGHDADGRLELFATASDTMLYRRVQLTPGGAWSAWESFGQGVAWPTVASNVDGRLELVGIRASRMVHRWQTSPNGGWSDWYTQDGAVQTPPTLALDGTGRLRVFAVGTDGAMLMKSESAPAAGPWTPWIALSSGIFLGYPAVGRDGDGRLEVVARTASRALWHTSEQAWGSGWNSSSGWRAWESFGGDFDVATPAIGSNQDGRLEMFAIGTNGHAYGRWQTSVNGAWSNWYDHGGTLLGTVSPVLAVSNPDGRLQMFTMDTGFAVASKVETAANSGPWIGWLDFGGRFGRLGTGDWSGPVAARNADGTLQLFLLGNAQVNTRRQTAPGGAWSAWTLL